MSASRDKKQRQEEPVEGLTQRQIKERKEAERERRNAKIYWAIGIVAAILVAALLIWDSGVFQRRATAVTVGSHEFNTSEVAFYYGEARQQYGMYLQMMGYDPTKPDREQIADEEQNQSFYDMFMGEAKKMMEETASLVDAAKKAGVKLEAEDNKMVDEAIANFKAQASSQGYPFKTFLKMNFGPHMTEAALRSCLEDNALSSKYYQEYVDGLEYSDDEIQKYYDEHTTDLDTFVYDVCFVSGRPSAKKDAEGNAVEATDEDKKAAMETARTEANALMESVKGGEKFDVQAELVANKVEGSYYQEANTSVGASLLSNYRDWLADEAREDGDITVVESEDNGCYVVMFHDRYLDEESVGTADIRHILVKAAMAEGAETATDEAMAEAEKKAQALLDQFLAGDKTAESFGELAKANSEDPGSKDNGGLYANVSRNSGFFPDFTNWIFAPERKVGDTGLVKNPQPGQQGYHVMYLEKQGDLEWRYSASNALRANDVQSWLEEIQTGYEAVEAKGAEYIG